MYVRIEKNYCVPTFVNRLAFNTAFTVCRLLEGTDNDNMNVIGRGYNSEKDRA